jgi:hypothetical protein
MTGRQETDLEQCWWDANGEHDGGMTLVGSSGVTRIVLVADGNGPMGHYDRIHVYNGNGKHLVFPAHHVSGWSVKP